MWLVAGLGNPGRRYEGTRHNVGFDVVDVLARRSGVAFRRSWRFPCELAEAVEPEGRLLLCKPRTFMNLSGQAVGPLLRRKGLATDTLIVIVDDTDLGCGKIRIRKRGSAGGHNGLKSVIASLGSDDFVRLRVGVGGRPEDRDMVDHVLSGFHPDERETMEAAVERSAEAVWTIVEKGVEIAMNRYNGS
jgi:PTH1 family peptidyl-tRNA hydrolase